MKAMNPEMFWALALHLQRCNHQLQLHVVTDEAVYARLSCGDPFYAADERTLFNFLTVDHARNFAASWGITELQVLDYREQLPHS